MKAASIAVFLAFTGAGYVATTSLRSARSSASTHAQVDESFRQGPGTSQVETAARPVVGVAAAPPDADALMVHLNEAMPRDDAERWKTAVELATTLRVYRFAALDRCPDVGELSRATVRVRWSTASSADGLAFSDPEILSTVPSTWKRCGLEILREGMRITAAELEGPLPISSVTLVLAIPVVVPSEIRERIAAAEQQIAENIRAGRPPLKAPPAEPPIGTSSPSP